MLSNRARISFKYNQIPVGFVLFYFILCVCVVMPENILQNIILIKKVIKIRDT